MEEKTFKVTLADGTSFTGLKQNGSYYITKKKITEKTFDGKLTEVTIEDSEGNTEVHTNMQLISIQPIDGGNGFAIADIPAEELERAQLLKTISEQNDAITELSEMISALI